MKEFFELEHVVSVLYCSWPTTFSTGVCQLPTAQMVTRCAEEVAPEVVCWKGRSEKKFQAILRWRIGLGFDDVSRGDQL